MTFALLTTINEHTHHTHTHTHAIDCSMSSIGSKWFGEGEKYARAVFTLASKISPCVVFIDEVDRYDPFNAFIHRRVRDAHHTTHTTHTTHIPITPITHTHTHTRQHFGKP
jgi:hypothetical protein